MNSFGIVCSCVVDIYLLHLFMVNYFDKRKYIVNHKALEKLTQSSAVVLLAMCNVLGNGDLNILVAPFLLLLYIMIMFSGKPGNKILSFITVLCTLYGTEFLFMIVFQPDVSAYKDSTDIILQILVIKLLSFILILVVNHVVGERKKSMDTKAFLMYMFIPLSSFMVMFTVFYSFNSIEMSLKIRMMLIFVFSFLFVGNIISFYAFKRYSEKLYQGIQQEMIIFKQEKDLEYYRQISKIDKKQKELIHNINNQMKMIAHFARSKDYDTILKISEEISDSMDKGTMNVYSTNTVLNSLLNEKKREAESQGILFKCYVEPWVSLNMISTVDMISMFGNLLDNAIRAASEGGGEKYIKVFIYMQKIDGFCVIKIVNAFKEIVYKDNRFVSTKTGDGIHGIGIESVNHIAEKYGGFLDCTFENNEFKAVLLLSTDEGKGTIIRMKE